MRTNEVTLFSNGIGHFRRVYQVNPKTPSKISIPFNKDHIGDVAASLQVFGGVKLNCPPSFTPANSQTTALTIDPKNTMRSLVMGLSGAEISLKTFSGGGSATPTTGTLMGLSTKEYAGTNDKITKDILVVLTPTGIQQFDLDALSYLQFADPTINSEIAKAMSVNLHRIKPNSVFLDLSISTSSDKVEEATVAYTIPVAAWKMRYAIREDSKGFTFEGAAVIDNNTDEDWDGFKISVVTGNPISFSTDIAHVVVPQRKFIKLVDDVALGNVAAQEALETIPSVIRCASMAAAGPNRNQRTYKMSAYSNTMGGFGAEDAELACTADASYENTQNVMAEAAVEVQEVGDFCVFSSKDPITIAAKKSAVVPMFGVTLDKAGVVLFYKEANHARRPYRAIKFSNTTDFSLGKGKTIVYKDGVFSGECVLEQTKPGDNRLLPHCLENGVRITREQKQTETVQSSIRITKGVACQEMVSTAVTEYTLDNRKEEKFQVVIEHPNRLQGNDLKITTSGFSVEKTEKIPDGQHFCLSIAPGQGGRLVVTERLVNTTQVVLCDYVEWLNVNIVRTDNPLRRDEKVKACIDLQEKIDALDSQEGEYHDQIEELKDQMSRVRENLKAAKDVSGTELVQTWVQDLGEAEKTLRDIEKIKLPALRVDRKKLDGELKGALKKLSAQWTSPEVETVKVVE